MIKAEVHGGRDTRDDIYRHLPCREYIGHLLTGSTAMYAKLAAHTLLLPSFVNGLSICSDASLAPSLSRVPEGIHLAVDYYPSQWPEWMWEPDVARMNESGISYVRISEFDWAVLEPKEGEYNFTLLDTTLHLFSKYGLKAIVGTPTAAPPNWLTEKYDVHFVDRTNTTLIFGSRRHYSFSSFDYRELSQKITRKLAERYGNHSSVVGWQLDK